MSTYGRLKLDPVSPCTETNSKCISVAPGLLKELVENRRGLGDTGSDFRKGL